MSGQDLLEVNAQAVFHQKCLPLVHAFGALLVVFQHLHEMGRWLGCTIAIFDLLPALILPLNPSLQELVRPEYADKFGLPASGPKRPAAWLGEMNFWAMNKVWECLLCLCYTNIRSAGCTCAQTVHMCAIA